jgi:hypothetical protein
MNYENISFWGILPRDTGSNELRDVAEMWASLSANASKGYQYEVLKDGEVVSGVAGSTDELAEAFTGPVSGSFETEEEKLRYRSVPFSLNLYGETESYPLAPCWEVAIDANRFRTDVGHSPETISDRVDAVVDLTTSAHRATGALYTYAQPTTDPYELSLHPDREQVTEGRLESLYWLTVFSPAPLLLAERTSLLSHPNCETKELNDGSIVVVCGDNPVETSQEKIREIESHIWS